MDDLLVAFCLVKFDALIDAVAELDDETANARPDLPGANSCYALLTHCLGMARRWSSTVNRGIEVPRDRDAEFTSRGSVAELVARARAVREAFAADARAVDLTAAPAAPPGDHDVAEDPWIATCGGVLLHVFEELCQHLGHVEITRDVLRASR